MSFKLVNLNPFVDSRAKLRSLGTCGKLSYGLLVSETTILSSNLSLPALLCLEDDARAVQDCTARLVRFPPVDHARAATTWATARTRITRTVFRSLTWRTQVAASLSTPSSPPPLVALHGARGVHIRPMSASGREEGDAATSTLALAWRGSCICLLGGTPLAHFDPARTTAFHLFRLGPRASLRIALSSPSPPHRVPPLVASRRLLRPTAYDCASTLARRR
ncbi:hypothetical protein K438DRAFT_1978279 [Mycena galopus ATCC 62051]|nr:hypothetical protein K438DRAFT_1978279 [Mycena galopus ATCC 62051]